MPVQAGRQLLTFPSCHHGKQHHCHHQQAQQEHSTPNQESAEKHKGVGELSPESGGQLLATNPRGVAKRCSSQ